MPTALFRPGDRPLFHLGLLLLTVGSTFGTFLFGLGSGVGVTLSEQMLGAALFSLTLVSILGTHEMGHYVYARLHRVDTSLPYFIPMPVVSAVGTLGAVIRIRGRIPTRNALVDIGAAGPLAGLVVAIPLLAVGFAKSEVVDVPPLPHDFPGSMSLWRLGGFLLEWARALLNGTSGPSMELGSSIVFGDNLLMLLLQWLVLGPLPAGKEVIAHPMVIAGWFGLLVTMINLIPIGQLDGGHVAYALFGPRAKYVGQAAALGLFGLCLFATWSWVLWLVISTAVIGFRHPPVVEPWMPLTRGRKIVAALCLLAFVLCMIPVPITQVSLP
jgi:membrane-associated protease RseP (regulator of RpoE activity)